MKILIKQGRVINPATGTDQISDLYIVDDKVIEIENDIKNNADLIIDATGCFVMPGYIDLHVHLREPGFEHKETILSGSNSAAKGGFTTICAMPNTNPATDSAEIVRYVVEKAKKESIVNVIPIGAITKGQNGEVLSDISQMKKAGIYALSEDGKSVMEPGIYKEAMKIAALENLPIFAHCEDINLVQAGVINKGKKSEELGLKGISNESEDIIIKRDIEMARETGVKLHICHCSTFGSMEILRDAKAQGFDVTGEVCPHHFTLTEDDILLEDSNYKMNPPLRTIKDRDALIQGLKENVFDVIATDHAPHHEDEKAKSINEAPFGIVGLETAAALTVTELLDKGILTPIQMAEKLSYNPARILGINKGDISVGNIADITILNPTEEYVIDIADFVSKSKNTPFNGKKVKGRIMYTIVEGKVAYKYDK